MAHRRNDCPSHEQLHSKTPSFLPTAHFSQPSNDFTWGDDDGLALKRRQLLSRPAGGLSTGAHTKTACYGLTDNQNVSVGIAVDPGASTSRRAVRRRYFGPGGTPPRPRSSGKAPRRRRSPDLGTHGQRGVVGKRAGMSGGGANPPALVFPSGLHRDRPLARRRARRRTRPNGSDAGGVRSIVCRDRSGSSTASCDGATGGRRPRSGTGWTARRRWSWGGWIRITCGIASVSGVGMRARRGARGGFERRQITNSRGGRAPRGSFDGDGRVAS